MTEGMATGPVAIGLPMARTDGRTNERVSHHSEIPRLTLRAREDRGFIDHSERELAEFIDRVRQHPMRLIRREGWIEPLSVTRVREYDQETERQRAFIHQGRKATA